MPRASWSWMESFVHADGLLRHAGKFSASTDEEWSFGRKSWEIRRKIAICWLHQTLSLGNLLKAQSYLPMILIRTISSWSRRRIDGRHIRTEPSSTKWIQMIFILGDVNISSTEGLFRLNTTSSLFNLLKGFRLGLGLRLKPPASTWSIMKTSPKLGQSLSISLRVAEWIKAFPPV